MPPMSPNLAVMMARLRANQTRPTPLYEPGSPLDLGVRTVGESFGTMKDAAGSVVDTVHSANRAMGALPANAWKYMTSAPSETTAIPSEYSVPNGPKILAPAEAAAMRAAYSQAHPAGPAATGAEPVSGVPLAAMTGAAPPMSGEPRAAIRYDVGKGMQDYGPNSRAQPLDDVATTTAILRRGAFNGGDMPRWGGDVKELSPGGMTYTGNTLRSAAQMEQDVNARNLLDEVYTPPDETPVMLARARNRALVAQEEAKAQQLSEDPQGINAYVAKKMADLQLARHSPEEQRRSEIDARRGEEAGGLARLRKRLADGGATPEETEAAVRKFVTQAALKQALRDGDYAPLASLLGQTKPPDDFGAAR